MNLRLDWCSYQAAKWAVEHWHYSKKMPVGKLSKIGVWESDKFIGVVIYGLGGGGACNGKKYGLDRNFQMAELQRIALQEHSTQVSRIVSISARLIHRHCPKLRLLISYADPSWNHHGGIYQAAGWIYTGCSPDDWKAVWPDGREAHSRIARAHVQFGIKKIVDISEAIKIPTKGKHRYLMPLDDEMRKRIEPLRKPYPKRDKQAIASAQDDSGGAAPTVTLQAGEA